MKIKALGTIAFLLMVLASLVYRYPEAVGVVGDRAWPDNVEIKAVYLVSPGGGEIAQTDFDQHPEVVVVQNLVALQRIIVGHKAAIWIDKNALALVDLRWLRAEPQKYYPVVLVGYNNALYAFREQLNIGSIKGPYIDWSKYNLESGFSVWKLLYDTDGTRQAFMKGYQEQPAVSNILPITDSLLAGRIPGVS